MMVEPLNLEWKCLELMWIDVGCIFLTSIRLWLLPLVKSLCHILAKKGERLCVEILLCQAYVCSM